MMMFFITMVCVEKGLQDSVATLFSLFLSTSSRLTTYATEYIGGIYIDSYTGERLIYGVGIRSYVHMLMDVYWYVTL